MELSSASIYQWDYDLRGRTRTVLTKDGARTPDAEILSLRRDSLVLQSIDGRVAFARRDVLAISEEGAPGVEVVGLIGGLIAGGSLVSETVEGNSREPAIAAGFAGGGALGWFIVSGAMGTVHWVFDEKGMVTIVVDSSMITLGEIVRFTWGGTAYELGRNDLSAERMGAVTLVRLHYRLLL